MKNVFTNKYSSFTYIEVLFALFITLLIFTMLPLLYKSITPIKHQSNFESSIDIEFFSRDLTETLLQRNSKALEIDKNGRILKFDTRENTIRYEFKNNKIIKTINNTGNITLLNNVTNAQFILLKNKHIKLKLKMHYTGGTFEKAIQF
ncbi:MULTISPECIES: competence type IV pilus minor pilin ComGF [Staphylococcus]|uniref:Competence protein n=2 Tax=Staphylococcus cohnii TaxID=29382 RepID=A0A2T4LQM4_9STAP|nr:MULTISPECIES: competence type IV pilus minor pilin ComGF [Staphylococcus]MCE5035069.1 ComGF family competence protein [Staphylococcus cohnii]PTF17987.1 competence protein [Staphylococcus cohnii]PTF23029.1 competence protein [Staphylococcus cohnii]PTF33449.1 competence protein [Staphylococcus cohnii]PTF34676.1 competence protein [Staphylococcus cohnii]